MIFRQGAECKLERSDAMKATEALKDWFAHLRVQPDANGIYPHPGMWLTRSDWTERWAVWQIMRFDSSVVAPVMCHLGQHRWITVGMPWTTRCWYCETPLGEDS